jgi:hypothetical protein
MVMLYNFTKNTVKYVLEVKKDDKSTVAATEGAAA